MKTLLTTTALILALTGGADAADTTGSVMLAGGPIYSTNTSLSICWWINLGSANITPKSQVMYAWDSNTELSVSTTCANNSSIGPGTTCYLYPTTSPQGVSCKVVFGTSAVNVRGSLELTDTNSNELSQVELR